MRDDRVAPAGGARALDLHVDRIVVRARGLRAEAARELGGAIAQALPAALAAAAERAGGAQRDERIELASLPLRVAAAPRAADVAAAAGSAAAAALASRLAAGEGGVS